jgi:hypothetical protein
MIADMDSTFSFGSSSNGATASFGHARIRGQRQKLWAAITGQSRQLLSLHKVEKAAAIGARRHAGIRTVALDQIRGSEGRCRDFDCDFNPLQSRTADRWRRVARARREDKPLPPVDLVQVGGIYFVRDGNHRISVARELGQRAIEAEVTVWEVKGPLPWERGDTKARGGSGLRLGATPQAA